MAGDVQVLIHAPHGADKYREWLLDHGCPVPLHVSHDAGGAEHHLGEAEVLFCWGFPSGLLPNATRLRWIQSMGAGVDDLLGTRNFPHGIDITRVVGPFGATISEYVFAVMLSRIRDLPRLRKQQATRLWQPFASHSLDGTTIGIAGLGFVGRELAKRARAFGMHVFGLSRTNRRADFVDRHFGPDEWHDFVRDLDYLVLALPLTPETHHVVNDAVFSALRPEAVLVNIGRGRLVDEDALIKALSSGRLAGAVLDVFETEPLPASSPLWDMESVLVTPHISGPSRVEQVADFFLDNLRRYLRDEPLVGLVDRAHGY